MDDQEQYRDIKSGDDPTLDTNTNCQQATQRLYDPAQDEGLK